MRIDRSELDNEPGDARMARRARLAPDDRGAVGKDQDKAAGSNDLPGAFTVTLPPASRIERAAEYRAAVDAAYRQCAIDHGYVEVEKPGRATVTQLASGDAYHGVAETTPALARDADGPRYPMAGTASADVQTGARGPVSGREFDPESAGGPIRQLDAREARISSEGVQDVTSHLRRFTGGGPLEGPEQAMLDRLASIAAGDTEPTSYDLNFYTH